MFLINTGSSFDYINLYSGTGCDQPAGWVGAQAWAGQPRHGQDCALHLQGYHPHIHS